MSTRAPIPIDEPRLLRIKEVAAETGLTTRAIRYYEEIGLLEPAARSDGDYRLYDASDLERLRFIKSLRDDAGFSLAQIGQLLEDEAARERNRERFAPRPATRRSAARSSTRPAPGSSARSRSSRPRPPASATMIEEARARRAHLDAISPSSTAARPAPGARAATPTHRSGRPPR